VGCEVVSPYASPNNQSTDGSHFSCLLRDTVPATMVAAGRDQARKQNSMANRGEWKLAAVQVGLEPLPLIGHCITNLN
jgi:hypothetical protein